MEQNNASIGGSRGGREGRTPPPGRPNSFDFMQFSGKFGVFTPPLEGSRPPLGKILDPPLARFLSCHCYLKMPSCKLAHQVKVTSIVNFKVDHNRKEMLTT